MPYVEQFSPMEVINDFDVSFEAACNAYNAAERRMSHNRAKLCDYEEDFIAEFKNQH